MRHAKTKNSSSRPVRHRYSCEHAMHEPAWGGGFAAVEAVAIEPEAATLFVFDAEIIPRGRRGLGAPPFHRDALRPFGERNRMQHAPPAKAQRRPVGNLGHHF